MHTWHGLTQRSSLLSVCTPEATTGMAECTECTVPACELIKE